MAAGKFGTIGKDGHGVWKAATAMEEVGKGGKQDRARGRRRNFCAKRIGLAGLEGEQHSGGMEVDGPKRLERDSRFPLSGPLGFLGSAGSCSKNRVLCFRASPVKLGYYDQNYA